jgi:hypothetical protein
MHRRTNGWASMTQDKISKGLFHLQGKVDRRAHKGGGGLGQAAACVTEPLESRVLLSNGPIFVVNTGGTIGEYSTTGATINAALVSGLSNPQNIAVSGSDLFVVSVDSRTIGEYTTSGALVNSALVTGLSAPDGIAVWGSDLFVTTGNASGGIGEYTTSGATVNANLISGLDFPSGIASTGSDLFITCPGSQSISEYTSSGAKVNGNLVTGLGTPEGIAISGSDIFVVNASRGTVGEYTTSGAAVNTHLISGLNNPDGITIAGSDLYVVNDGTTPSNGSIGEYTLSGAPVNAALVTGLDGPYGIAVPTGPASVSGIVYDDKDGSGAKHRKDPVFSNVTITLQQLKGGKPYHRGYSTTSDGNGNYSFNNLIVGATYEITESVPRRYALTQPSTGAYTINLSAGQDLTGENFGNHPSKSRSRVVRASQQDMVNGEVPHALASSLGGDAAGADGNLKSLWSLE